MRTETITHTYYTAAELKEHHPHAFDTAWDRYREDCYRDPAWADEGAYSLKSALEALSGYDEVPENGGTRDRRSRMMAWLENNVLSPLRIPWTGEERKRLRQYGIRYYAPGKVRPCPWTGYYLDDVLLDTMRECARDGMDLAAMRRAVEYRAQRAYEDDLDAECAEDTFLETAEVNGWEFDEHGRMV